VNVFLHPLQQLAGTPNKILSDKEITSLFGNVDTIFTVNKTLLIQLGKVNCCSCNSSSFINQSEIKHTVDIVGLFLKLISITQTIHVFVIRVNPTQHKISP
jgi:hypothetical protein